MYQLIAVFVFLLCCAFSLPNELKAHSSLLDSMPAPKIVTEDSPEEVSLRFNEPVELDLANLIIYDWNAETVFVGQAESPGERAPLVEFAIPELADGTYTVKWSVVSLDGHPVNGSYSFAVGKATKGGVKTVSSNNNSDGFLIAARTIAQGLITLIAGLYWFSWLAEKRGFPKLNTIVYSGKVIVLSIVFLATLIELAAYAFSLPPGLIKIILQGRWDLLQQFPFMIMVGVQFVFLCLLLIPGMQRGWYLIVWFILACIPAFGGHIWGIPNVVLAAIPRVFHQLSMALWLGALLYVILLIIHNKRINERLLPQSFHSFFVKRMMLASGLVVLSGVLMVFVQTSWTAVLFDWKNWSTLLLIKIILTLCMLALALFQTLKWKREGKFTTPKLIHIEWLIGIGIIFVGVWLSQINYPIAVKSYDTILSTDNQDIEAKINKLQSGEQDINLVLPKIDGQKAEELVINLSMPDHDMRSGPFSTTDITDNKASLTLPFTMPGIWKVEIKATYADDKKIQWVDELYIVGE